MTLSRPPAEVSTPTDPHILACRLGTQQQADLLSLLATEDRTLDAVITNLATSGRSLESHPHEQLAPEMHIATWLERGAPLVTVQGSAGSGKTSLAAHTVLDRVARGERVLIVAHATALEVLLGRLPSALQPLVARVSSTGQIRWQALEHAIVHAQRAADSAGQWMDREQLFALQHAVESMWAACDAVPSDLPPWSRTPHTDYPLSAADETSLVTGMRILSGTYAGAQSSWPVALPAVADIMPCLERMSFTLPSAEAITAILPTIVELERLLADAPRSGLREADGMQNADVDQMVARLDTLLAHPEALEKVDLLPAGLDAWDDTVLLRAATALTFHEPVPHACQGAAAAILACRLAPGKIFELLVKANDIAREVRAVLRRLPHTLRMQTAPALPVLIEARARLAERQTVANHVRSVQAWTNQFAPASAELLQFQSAGLPQLQSLRNDLETLQPLLEHEPCVALLQSLRADPFATMLWAKAMSEQARAAQLDPIRREVAELLGRLADAGAPDEVLHNIQHVDGDALDDYVGNLGRWWDGMRARAAVPDLATLNQKLDGYRVALSEQSRAEQDRRIDAGYAHARKRLWDGDLLRAVRAMTALSKTAVGKKRAARHAKLREQWFGTALLAAPIVACTPEALHHLPAKRHMFDIAILDEAGLRSWVEALTAILRARQTVLVADDDQTNAGAVGYREPEAADNDAPTMLGPEFSASQFAGVLVPHATLYLADNYRSRPPIVRLTNALYEVPRRARRLENPLRPAIRIVPVGGSRLGGINRSEAEWIARDIAQRSLRGELLGQTVAVISMLGESQLKAVKSALCTHLPGVPSEVKLGTARALQGMEFDLVYITSVESGRPRLLALDNRNAAARWTVALSRAREEVVWVHSLREMARHDLRRQLLATAEREDELASALQATRHAGITALGYRHCSIGDNLWHLPAKDGAVVLMEDGSLRTALDHDAIVLTPLMRGEDKFWLSSQLQAAGCMREPEQDPAAPTDAMEACVHVANRPRVGQ